MRLHLHRQDGLAAQIAALDSFETPTLESVERRRFQLWLLSMLLLLTVAVAFIVFTFWKGITPPSWMTPDLLEGSILGLLVLFCAYAIEKEVQLRRLMRALIEEKVLVAALTGRVSELGSLLEAGKAMNLVLDLDEVLDTILQCAMDLLRARDGSIMLVHGEDELRTVCVKGTSGAVGARAQFGGGVAGRVAVSREPLLINGTIVRDPAVARADAPPPPGSAMSVPLIHRGSLLGVLNVNAADGAAYTAHELRALSLFGEQAAGALANAQLYEAQRLLASQNLYMALHDPLTNLPNRALFLDRFQHAMSRRHDDDRAVALLFLDLDDFKMVNDTYGHAAGDEALVAFADRLRGIVRLGDTVARFSGDEFAVLVEDVRSASEATLAAQRIATGLTEPFDIAGHKLTLQASVGIAIEGPAGHSVEEMLHNADTAMYMAKSNNRGGARLYDESMRSDTLHRLSLEKELGEALDRGQFSVQYQPVINLVDARVTGAEALVRWHHPIHGILAASSFITLAESSGLLPALDLWVLEQACGAVDAMAAGSPGTNGLAIMVNVSPSGLRSPSLVDDIGAVLQRTGTPPGRVVLEIPERAILRDTERMAEQLTNLKSLGVRLTLDDFGTGYSSLSYLRRLPVDSVKIDRIFIEGLSRDPGRMGLVQAIIRLAQSLTLDVIAEGVEQQAELDTLQAIGCRMAQGYILCEPLSLEALAEFVGQRGISG